MSYLLIEDVELHNGLIAEVHYQLDDVTGIDPVKMRIVVRHVTGELKPFNYIHGPDLKRMIAASVSQSIGSQRPISESIKG